MQERRPLLSGPAKRSRVGSFLLAVGALALVAATASYHASQRDALEEAETGFPSSQEPQPGVEQWRPMAPPRFDATYGAGYPGYASSYGAGYPYGNLPADSAAAYQQPSYAQMYASNNPLAGTAVTYMPPGGAPQQGVSQEEATAMGTYQPYPYGPMAAPMPGAFAPGPTGPGGAWADYGPQTQTQIVINGDGSKGEEGEEGEKDEEGEEGAKEGDDSSQSVTVTVPQGPLPVNFPAVQLDPAGAPFGSTASTAK